MLRKSVLNSVSRRGYAFLGLGKKKPLQCSADEALTRFVKSGTNIYLGWQAATPLHLMNSLYKLRDNWKNVGVLTSPMSGEFKMFNKECEKNFRVNSMFIGTPNDRAAINEKRGDWTPIHLSQISLLWLRNIIPIETALIHCSMPDEHGWMTLGTSLGDTPAAVSKAKYIIAQINPNMPTTCGETQIHISQVDALVETNDPLNELPEKAPSAEEVKIGDHIAKRIPDGACLQMGIGGVPAIVLSRLINHKHLSIHTEMFSTNCMDLVERGVVDNSQKVFMPGRSVMTFARGNKKMYKWLNNNPSCWFLPGPITNDSYIIGRNPKHVSINAAIEVDLTGQVCADSIGTRLYSGTGGQTDFVRGALLSEGGAAYIVLSSSTVRGEPRIVPFLKPGAGVVTHRCDVQYVVTEYGVADLFGKCVRERAVALAKIAHPDHRPRLFDYIRKQYGPYAQI
eukprot:TRINITY_DN5381_c0_g1_i1.p1 TRINITY_DN5381_c0_g1~~TRINITY_DN5381_c0_g1_i1.p1  ORF type:complete len:470 (-),score=88.23 TRINITY_DN5381_c0_g1_i1:90-1448(-)